MNFFSVIFGMIYSILDEMMGSNPPSRLVIGLIIFTNSLITIVMLIMGQVYWGMAFMAIILLLAVIYVWAPSGNEPSED